MKSGVWINYATGAEFPVTEHEQWLRAPGNTIQAGLSEQLVKTFDQFGKVGENRDEFMRYVLKKAPLIRVRGHGSSITFEYDSKSNAPLDYIFLWAKKNSGPFTGIHVYNLASNDGFQMTFQDFEKAYQSGGHESLIRTYSEEEDIRPKSARCEMNRLASDWQSPGGVFPPHKVGPKRKQFPGDTLTNQDGEGGSGSLAYGEPFGDEHGLKSPDGGRGELIPDSRPPGNIGVPLNPMSPGVNSDDTQRKQKVPSVYRAFTVYPIPKEEKESEDNRLLLQIPRDLKERYHNLSRRVHEYVRNLDVDGFDIYEYDVSPPSEWVQEDLNNIDPDWADGETWKEYLGSVDHDDIATWVDFNANDPQDIAPGLHSQFVLEAAEGTFHDWFLTNRPQIGRDDRLVSYIQDSTRDSSYGLGKGYTKHWKTRYAQEAEHRAYQSALSRWTDYVKNNGSKFVQSSYKDSYDTIHKVKDNRIIPLDELVSSLENLPYADRQDIDGFREEMDSIVNEGMHAMDFARDPVSREDRMFGDMQHEGFCYIPMNRIAWTTNPDVIKRASKYKDTENVPVKLYRYGDRFFLVDESDAYLLVATAMADRPYVLGDVFRVIPGSSIRKAYTADIQEFNKKSEALANAIWDVQRGADKEGVLLKYGRIYGPNLRRAIDDYFYIQGFRKDADPGLYDNSESGNSCATFWNDQSADNCDGCTFNVGTGGPEFGYGGACSLTHLFMNAPEHGYGRGDTSAYDPEHVPGNPSRQKHPSKLLAKKKPVEPKYKVGDVVTYKRPLPDDEPRTVQILFVDTQHANLGWGIFYDVWDEKAQYPYRLPEAVLHPAQLEMFESDEGSKNVQGIKPKPPKYQIGDNVVYESKDYFGHIKYSLPGVIRKVFQNGSYLVRVKPPRDKNLVDITAYDFHLKPAQEQLFAESTDPCSKNVQGIKPKPPKYKIGDNVVFEAFTSVIAPTIFGPPYLIPGVIVQIMNDKPQVPGGYKYKVQVENNETVSKTFGFFPSKKFGYVVVYEFNLMSPQEELFASKKVSPELINQLAASAGLDISGFSMDQLIKGYIAEKEHDTGGILDVVKSPEDLIKITLAHLLEDPRYYSKLEKIETPKEK